MSKLMPCPFCGGEAEDDTDDNGCTGVKCKECTAEIWCGKEWTSRSDKAAKAWNTRSLPSLPSVSPEGLVEGEWYVFNYHSEFIPMIGKAEIHQGKFRLVDSFHSSKWAWANSETSIYGPLRFRIGGAE